MYDVILIVAPVFGLIALGFVLARFGIVSEQAGSGLSEFVFTVAVPALLFRMMVTAEPVEDASPFAIWGAFYGAVAITWGLSILATRYLLHRSARDGASISMGCCFGNIVMLGIPLSLDRFGSEAGVPLALILSISSPLLWFAGTLHIELAQRRGDMALGTMLKDLVISLLKNPIILGLLAGIAWRATGLGLHPIPDKMIALLGQAAVPAALVALGLGLTAFQLRGQLPTIAVICVLSLAVYPAIAWMLAFHVFDLPPLWAGVAVLLAACPPGANAYLFATRYEAATGSVSAAVALGTALSIVSVTLILFLLRGQIQ
jgi:malonate transporter and related proteins